MKKSLLMVLGVLAFLALAAGPATDTAEPVTRTQVEVEALIAKEGPANPAWLEGVATQYPRGLDLSWQESKEGWKPNKYIGQYIITVLNPDPKKWRGGIKLLHQTLEVNKASPAKLQQSMQALGQAYFNYERDWSRAAYWLLQAKPQWAEAKVMIAECYWRLGCKPMAVSALDQLGPDRTREGRLIQLRAGMGDLPKALAMAEDLAKSGAPDAAYLSAAIACRRHGKFTEAAKYYEQVIAATTGGRDLKRNQERAQRGLEAVQIMEKLDLKRVGNGTYGNSSQGYRGPVWVEIKVAGGRITDCKVLNHRDDMCFTAPTVVPAGILANQGFQGVDSVTGATISSEAVVNAAARALAGAKGK